MKTLIAHLLLFLFSTLLVDAAPLSTNEILAQLQTTLETGNGFDAVVENLEKLEEEELILLLKEFDRTFPRLRETYLKGYQLFVEGQYTGAAKNEQKKLIREHRENFMRVYAMGEGPMKPELKKISMPAIDSLRKLILPSNEEIFSTADEKLKEQRKIVLILARFRDAIVKTAILPDQDPAEASILAAEKSVISGLAGLPREGLKIIAENDKIAEKAKVPINEREGVREVNEWRLLLGLNALVIDPKLCAAGREHSEDMNKHQFFAHESPLPGKTTPWQRAGNHGTKASGENIYMGSESPSSANKGWFYSPGHHKNMFRKGHTRIGLGQYSRHWTQMFG